MLESPKRSRLHPKCCEDERCRELYVEDADATYQRALEAGGTSILEPQDMFYGDRHGGVKDPSGNSWWIATHIEDVSAEELKSRGEAAAEERKRAAENA